MISEDKQYIVCNDCGKKVKMYDDNGNKFEWADCKRPLYPCHPDWYTLVLIDLDKTESIDDLCKECMQKVVDEYVPEDFEFDEDEPNYHTDGQHSSGFVKVEDIDVEPRILKNGS